MTYQDLEKGRKIADEIKDLDRVIEHFMKWESGKHDPIEFVRNYLVECRMVGDDKTRKSLAIGFITDSISFLNTKRDLLQKDFDSI